MNETRPASPAPVPVARVAAAQATQAAHAALASTAPAGIAAAGRVRVALRGPRGVFARPKSDPRSLFGELLDWVLAPLLFLWPMSLALTWIVAQNIAHQPFDAELARLVHALAAQASAGRNALAEGRPGPALSAEVERAAQTLLRGDDEQRWFQVLGRRGELLAGDSALLVPNDDAMLSGEVHFRDDNLRDEPVRVAYLWLATGNDDRDSDALVQVAETLTRRERLAVNIIKGVLLPQFLILPVAVMLVWLALSHGFRPLEELQQRIRRRQSHDLSPIPERDVPEEVAPLVRSINDLLQRLDKSMVTQRQFLADAAHQLKTPLAGLRMQAELAAREIDSGRRDPAAMKHSLRQIAVSSQRAAHMVNQLLAMARADADATALRAQRVDLGAITRAVVRDFVPRAMARRIDLGYEGPEDAEGHAVQAPLMAEPVLLGELVRNLVDNALQYTPPGGTVTARVRMGWVHDAGEAFTAARGPREEGVDPPARGAQPAVSLEVEDTGPGIAPAERERVFQPFYRVLGTNVDGSGLGLAIVQEVAARHGARVTIDDAHPRSGATDDAPGARFTVTLPQRLVPPSS